MTSHCHKLIAETAQAMAHELYDTLMHNNQWYARWRKNNPGASAKALESRFVARNWGKLVPGARATLAGMLNGPTDQTLKEQIYEALLFDSTLTRGRGNTRVIGTASQH